MCRISVYAGGSVAESSGSSSYAATSTRTPPSSSRRWPCDDARFVRLNVDGCVADVACVDALLLRLFSEGAVDVGLETVSVASCSTAEVFRTTKVARLPETGVCATPSSAESSFAGAGPPVSGRVRGAGIIVSVFASVTAGAGGGTPSATKGSVEYSGNRSCQRSCLHAYLPHSLLARPERRLHRKTVPSTTRSKKITPPTATPAITPTGDGRCLTVPASDVGVFEDELDEVLVAGLG